MWIRKIHVDSLTDHDPAPPASLARSVLKPCTSKPFPPNCDAPLLTTTASEWMNDDPKRFSDFFIFFIEMNFRWKKFCHSSKICEKRFLSEKNPTSSFKIGGWWWSKKVLCFFFYRNEVQVEKKIAIFQKSAKNVFYRKKIRLQVSKSGDDDDPKRFSDFFIFFIEIKFR